MKPLLPGGLHRKQRLCKLSSEGSIDVGFSLICSFMFVLGFFALVEGVFSDLKLETDRRMCF